MACRTPPMPLRPMDLRRLRPGAVTMDTQRLILLFIFGFSILMLWEAWEREHRPKPVPAAITQPAAPLAPQAKAADTGPSPGQIASTSGPAEPGETIRITTDLVIAEVDTRGGTL